MFRTDPIQTNFTSGELSPWLYGRIDIERYVNGAAQLENFIVRHQGPIAGRLGTKYLALSASNNVNNKVRIVEFIYSREDAILVELSAGQFRFFKNNQLITDGGSPVVVSMPYGNSDLFGLQFTQSADVLFITHPSFPPATLSRYSDTDWVFEQPEFFYGPYLDQRPGDPDISLTVHTVTDRVILSSTANDFTGLSVGDYVQYQHNGQKVLGVVTLPFNDTQVEVEPLEDRSLFMAREVYSPGLYLGWDGTNSVPTYDATITGTGVSVAFSAVSVVTQEHIGNYLRFSDRDGNYYWMTVTSVGDIPRQGAYGILAQGDILTVTEPTGFVTRSKRAINARLRSSDPSFFNLTTDAGRLFRLVLGGNVLHARGRATVVRNGEMEDGDRNIGLSDTSGILVGDTVAGVDIPSNAIVEYIVEDTYIHISETPTGSNPAVELTINANSTQDIGVELNRSVPKSIEGLAVVQNGTTNDWNRGSWYVGNYPSTAAFHEGRLCFAGSPSQPNTGWMSVVDDFYNFATVDDKLKVLDDSAITFTISSDSVNIIQWMISRQVLIIGTFGCEWKVASTTQGSPITPTTISVVAQGNNGSAFVKPVNIGKSTLYIQRGGRKLREMSYDFQVDSQVSLDLTVFAEHLFKEHGGATQICYQQLPESVVYVLMADGTVAALTYEPDQKVYAWSLLRIGGPSAKVESIACLPGTDRDYLYLVVSRTVNSSNRRTVECLDPEYRPTSATDKSGMIFLDSYSSGTPESIVSGGIPGLLHLAGCTVNLLVDDLVHHDLVVSSGGVLTLPATPVSRWAVGHAFSSVLKTLPLSVQLQSGTTNHRPKRITHLNISLISTIGFSHGRSLDSLVYEDFRVAEDPVNASPPMFTGEKRVSFEAGYDNRSAYYVVQSKSYPINVCYITPEAGVY